MSKTTSIDTGTFTNVGIGESAPTRALEIRATADTTTGPKDISLIGTDKGDAPRLSLQSYYHGIDADQRTFQLQVVDGNNTAIQRNMVLQPNGGDVGIGTIFPALTVPAGHAIGPMFGLKNNLSASISLFRDDTSIVNGNAIGGIFFYGNGSSDAGNAVTAQELASIECKADEGHNDDDHGSALYFHTNNGTTNTRCMVLDKNGNVGIGAATVPTADLELKSQDNSGQTNMHIWSGRDALPGDDGMVGAWTSYGIKTYDNTKPDYSFSIGMDSKNHSLPVFKIDSATHDWARPGENTFLSIDRSGSVGIGTATSSERLRVHETRPTYHLMARFQDEGNDDTTVATGDGLVKAVRINSRPSGYGRSEGVGFITYLDMAVDAENAVAGFGVGYGSSTLPAGQTDLSQCEIVLKPGKVGIGDTTDPTAPLDINANVDGFNVDGHMVIQNTPGATNGDYQGIGFSCHGNVDDGNIKNWFGTVHTNTYGRSAFVFLSDHEANNNPVSSNDEIMRIAHDQVNIHTQRITHNDVIVKRHPIEVGNYNRRVQVNLSNYSCMRVRISCQRTNANDSFVYWEGYISNNDNDPYYDVLHQKTIGGSIQYSFAAVKESNYCRFVWDFNNHESPGNGSITLESVRGNGTILVTTY